MSWFFVLFAALAIATFYGAVDERVFILALLVVAPFLILRLALLFVQSLFTRSAALRLGPVIAALAAAALLAAWYYYGPPVN